MALQKILPAHRSSRNSCTGMRPGSGVHTWLFAPAIRAALLSAPWKQRVREGAAVKLTKRLVDSLRGSNGECFVWDSELPGFGPRVLPSGRKT